MHKEANEIANIKEIKINNIGFVNISGFEDNKLSYIKISGEELYSI